MNLNRYFSGFWHYLVVVDQDYPSVGHRRRVELLRSLIIPFFFFTCIGIYFTHGEVRHGLEISLLFQVSSYFLSRTRFLSIAMMFAVLAASVPQYYPAVVLSDIGIEKLGHFIHWMWIPLILSSLWLSPSHYAIFAVTHLTLVASAPSFYVNVVWSDIFMHFTISLIGATMLWGATLVRNRELNIIEDESMLLRERKEMLSTIQDNIQEMIVVCRDDGRLISANHALMKLYDIVSEDLNKGVFLGDIIDFSQGSGFNETDILTSAKSRKVKSTRGNGSLIPLEVKFTATEIHGAVHYIGVLRDVRQQIAYENLLKNEKDVAQQESRAKSEFISNISHELRTPLNAVLGFAQLMELDIDNLAPQHVESLKEIRRAGEHLLELISEMLDLAAIEAGRLKLSMCDVVLRDVFEECHALCSTLANRKQVNVTIQYPDGLTVYADPMRLKQVLLNLLSNAIKYNRTGGMVQMYCEKRSANVLRINVVDSGYGLSLADIARLFQPFERMSPNTDVEGVGIGLVISKKMVELMGGRVGINSEEQKGSTFWVEFDMTQAGAEPVTSRLKGASRQ